MAIQKWPSGLPRKLNQQFPKINPISDWFEIYRISDTVFALLEPHHDEEVFSYLLIGESQAVLIDTGMGISNILAEVANITDLSIVVLNTHSHFDHTGDNHRFSDVACFDNQYELNNLRVGHSKPFCSDFMQLESYRNLPNGFNIEDYEIKPSKNIRKLKHLDQIDLGNRILTVHHTPGHSPGSICVEDSLLNVLFTGDTYYRGTMVVHLPGSNFQDFIKTVSYLYSQRNHFDFLCPSHNECFAPKEDIESLYESIKLIERGDVPYSIDSESHLYQFENFNLRLPLNL